MAYIQLPPDGAGKKHRSWEITEGADDVHATAGVVTAPDGTVLAEADGLVVQGGVASGAADSGDPVKVGGVYHLSDPTYDDGDRADIRVDESGRLMLSYQSLVQLSDGDQNTLIFDQVDEDDVNPNRAAVPVRGHMYGFEGATWDRVRSTGGALNVADGGGSLTVDGSVTATGNVASGAADSGNPVKVGGVYNVTPPSIDDGDRADLQVDENGRLITSYQSLMQITDADGFGLVLDQVTADDTLASRRALPTRSHLYGFDGTAWDRLRGDVANGLDVDVTRLPALPAGTNNIGDVDVLTLPALPAGTNNIGDVDVVSLPALPAGNNNIGDVDVASVAGTVATQDVRPSTSSVTSVNDTASSVQLLASTAGRLAASIFNDSTEPLYVKFGTTASATSFTVKILAGGYFEFPQPVYTGRVDGIWNADASGAARITELTA